MEETIGLYWHRFITRQADNSYPDACVNLSDINNIISVFFRALGGDGGLIIEAAAAREHHAQRSWLQRVAGTHRKAALAWRDEQTLRLPPKLALYPTQQLNRELYFWLAALAAVDDGHHHNWLKDNQRFTAEVLKRYPGLVASYQRLLQAELKRRSEISPANKELAILERHICNALQSPGSVDALPTSKLAPSPVYLWLYPSRNAPHSLMSQHSDQEEEEKQNGISRDSQQKHRYQAEQVEMPDGKDGMLTMRWENIFSLAEYIKVNRSTDEDDDENAAQKAADMDILSIARDQSQKTSASRLRLDLDLPAAEYDDTPLEGEVKLPEWNWRKAQLLADQCIIRPMLPRGSEPKALPHELQSTARKLRGQFAALSQNRIWLRQQKDGMEIDTQAYIEHFITLKTQASDTETGLYRDLRAQQRDIATLMLADLSLSTDAAVNNQQRVIDVIRDTLLLFSEAMSACGDRYALYGFSSRKREQVRFYHLKQFDDAYDDTIRGHIQAIRPGYYTRLGAAIRHASNILEKQTARKRLLLILTDGKPNDLDKYEGRYGVEDTRHAILEAKQKGLLPFCITIDRDGDDYLPYLFGSNGYVKIQQPQELTKKLLLLYSQLTSNT